jgi:hypothetical protein
LISFAYVYFFESRVFNGLQPIQTKKSFPFSGSAPTRPKCGSIAMPRPCISDHPFDPARFNDIARISAFLKKLRTRIFLGPPPYGPAEFHRHRALAIALFEP